MGKVFGHRVFDTTARLGLSVRTWGVRALQGRDDSRFHSLQL